MISFKQLNKLVTRSIEFDTVFDIFEKTKLLYHETSVEAAISILDSCTIYGNDGFDNHANFAIIPQYCIVSEQKGVLLCFRWEGCAEIIEHEVLFYNKPKDPDKLKCYHACSSGEYRQTMIFPNSRSLFFEKLVVIGNLHRPKKFEKSFIEFFKHPFLFKKEWSEYNHQRKEYLSRVSCAKELIAMSRKKRGALIDIVLGK